MSLFNKNAAVDRTARDGLAENADMRMPLRGTATDRHASPKRFANDDTPGISIIVEQAGEIGRNFSKLSIAIGVLAGVILGVSLMAITTWTASGSSPVSNWIFIFALISPLASLLLYFMLTHQIGGLALSLRRSQELERRLDRAGQITALSRELEHEAAQIESRIEQFLSVGAGLRQDLRRDQDAINHAFSEKITQTRNAIHDIESARLIFLEDINNVNETLKIARDFITAKIATITTDFEDAALSAARTLDSNLTPIAQKFRTIIVKDAVRQESVDRLIEANEKTILVLDQTPQIVRGHIENALIQIQQDLEKNVDRLTGQIETLSDNISRSNVDLVKNLAEPHLQIANHVAELHSGINNAFDQNSQKYVSNLTRIAEQTDQLVERLQALIGNFPEQIETSFTAIEPDIAQRFNTKIQSAKTEIGNVLVPFIEANSSLEQVLQQTPEKLDRHIIELGSKIDQRFSENANIFADRMNSEFERQAERTQIFAEQVKLLFSEIENRFNHIEPDLRMKLTAILTELDAHIGSVTSQIVARLESQKSEISSTTNLVSDTAEKAISDQTQKIVSLLLASSQHMQDAIASTFSQQELKSKEFESQFVALIDEFKKAKNDIQNLPVEISGSIQNHVKSLDEAIDIVLNRFTSALQANQDLATKSLAGQLGATQQNLSHEYSLIEGRLFRSLTNFNEVVKNCISALEEASTWRLDAFDGQIKSIAEDNLDQVRKDFESLAERLKLKIGELKIESSVFEHVREAGEDGQLPPLEATRHEQRHQRVDPNSPIEKLSERLANIDAILQELRQGSR